MLYYLFLFFAVNSITALHPAADIAQVTHTALTQRPSLKAHEQTIYANKQYESQARSAYMPQLSLNHSTVFDQEHSTLETSTHTISLNGSQLIFSANGPQLKAKIAAQGTARAQYQFEAANHQVRHDTISAFLDAWLLQEKKPLIDALTATSECTLTQAVVAASIEQTNKHQLAKSESKQADDQIAIQSYPHQLQTATATLTLAMGTPTSTPLLHYQPEPAPQLDEVQDYIDQAYLNRPELKEKEAAIEQHTLTARSHRLSYLPSFHLTGSIGRTFAGTQTKQGTNANVGLSAKWQFFDGMQQHHAAHAADAQALRTQFEEQELRLRINQEVTKAFEHVHTATAEVVAANHDYQLEHGKWQRDNRSYKLGMLANAPYYQQKYQLELAAHTLRNAQVNLRKKLETLAYRCGYPATLFSQ